ncbi:hypothetical protein SARC_01406 [Sphaeroforma arctica JP610]|uniref:Uncharacterized protein n=1 Tax=Sphaeroforma arctica JP610 TaxID=667725 RepID=A0A0L0GBS6_9EUKA|nr:hypothetical protein SARC_01406 [Sphaeroforma arctica JP610]KNC86450.1 hypothetical protein SARC_01406 [Sphaeroforma arctica JP610]|eukprot:XP_014160352.1 hypothetical protein SARC_01406 [Sphaeroforma arctica JP610]
MLYRYTNPIFAAAAAYLAIQSLMPFTAAAAPTIHPYTRVTDDVQPSVIYEPFEFPLTPFAPDTNTMVLNIGLVAHTSNATVADYMVFSLVESIAQSDPEAVVYEIAAADVDPMARAIPVAPAATEPHETRYLEVRIDPRMYETVVNNVNNIYIDGNTVAGDLVIDTSIDVTNGGGNTVTNNGGGNTVNNNNGGDPDTPTMVVKECRITHPDDTLNQYLDIVNNKAVMVTMKPDRWMIEYVSETEFTMRRGAKYLVAEDTTVPGTDGDNIRLTVNTSKTAPNNKWIMKEQVFIQSVANDYIVVNYSSADVVMLMVTGKFIEYEDQKWHFVDCI